MTDHDPDERGADHDAIEEPVSEVLAQMTGKPVSEFRADDYEYPELEDLESVPQEEW